MRVPFQKHIKKCTDLDNFGCSKCNEYYDVKTLKKLNSEESKCVWALDEQKCRSLDWASRNEVLFTENCEGYSNFHFTPSKFSNIKKYEI